MADGDKFGASNAHSALGTGGSAVSGAAPGTLLPWTDDCGSSALEPERSVLVRAHVITYGCQMNEYDTHTIQSELVAGGHELVQHEADAELIVLNTCAVRGKPVEKVVTKLGELRKAKSQGRPLTVALMGCLAQLEEGREIAEKFGVEILIGPGAITDILSALEALEAGATRHESRAFKPELHRYIPPAPDALTGFLTIMRGCNHHCTYCIVPQTRGPEVSRPLELILREA